VTSVIQLESNIPKGAPTICVILFYLGFCVFDVPFVIVFQVFRFTARARAEAAEQSVPAAADQVPQPLHARDRQLLLPEARPAAAAALLAHPQDQGGRARQVRTLLPFRMLFGFLSFVLFPLIYSSDVQGGADPQL
jgi:hypothetical protein